MGHLSIASVFALALLASTTVAAPFGGGPAKHFKPDDKDSWKTIPTGTEQDTPVEPVKREAKDGFVDWTVPKGDLPVVDPSVDLRREAAPEPVRQYGGARHAARDQPSWTDINPAHFKPTGTGAPFPSGTGVPFPTSTGKAGHHHHSHKNGTEHEEHKKHKDEKRSVLDLNSVLRELAQL